MSEGKKGLQTNSFEFDFTQSSKIFGRAISDGLPCSEWKLYGQGFVNDASVSRVTSSMLPPLLADLVDTALNVYLADRLLMHRSKHYPQSHLLWGRKFKLILPSRSPEFWNKAEVKDSLQKLLRHFTEDEWQIDFVLRQKNLRQSEAQSPLFDLPVPCERRVALFSGGLDSFAGAAQQIFDLPKCHFILVSGFTHYRQKKKQHEQVEVLRKNAGDRIFHTPIFYGLTKNACDSQEQTQRSRGFLFLTLGVVTAIAAEASELFVYENGIGAINLPCDGTQIGTMCTRAVNPISLVKMEQFVSQLIQAPFNIKNPFQFQTKTEMCLHPFVQSLAEETKLTFSCDGFPIRKKGQAQCGICTSCVLRRQSLEGAGLSAFDPADFYLNDWQLCSGNRSKLHPLFSMEWQAHRLATCLKSPAPWESLVVEFPLLLEVAAELSQNSGCDSGIVRRDLLRMYRQYVNEWSGFSAHKFISQLAISA